MTSLDRIHSDDEAGRRHRSGEGIVSPPEPDPRAVPAGACAPRRFASGSEAARDAANVLLRGPLVAHAYAGGLDSQLRERIMVAVSEVNACGGCTRVHRRWALRAGVSSGELEMLRSGDLEHLDPRSRAAVSYAVARAEGRFEGPASPATERSADEHLGVRERREVDAIARAMALANLSLNTLVAHRPPFRRGAALHRVSARVWSPLSRKAGAHAEPQSLGADEAAFRSEHPGYGETAPLDELRRSDFARLDSGGHVYLDYTGGGLYADSQLAEHMALLRNNVFGNPHSVNPPSALSTQLLERTRARVLEFFRASPDEYEAIFTPNATGALRLVGEAYPFHPGDRFLLTFDNHNSVNGIREFARARGAETTYVPSVAPELRVDESLLGRYLTETLGDRHNLFAYPAQSNFSGVLHPLDWIEQAHAHGWDVLLDAAAYVPTNRLDLSRWHPDYVASSFYKMFGWPTGIGCLIARRAALAKLERPWFSGGTIVAAFVQRQYYQSAPGAAHFEDGTVNYLSLPAVEIGLDLLDRIGLETIHARVAALSDRLLGDLGALRHSDGSPAAIVYGPRTWQQRGATIAFNFLHPDGRVVDERYVDRVAHRHNVSLRTGCFCNPGAGELAFTISRETLVGGEFGDGMALDDYVRAIGLPSGGAIRASLGLATNFNDIDRFSRFAVEFVDLIDVPGDLPPRVAC